MPQDPSADRRPVDLASRATSAKRVLDAFVAPLASSSTAARLQIQALLPDLSFNCLLAAWILIHHRWTGAKEVDITTAAGERRFEIDARAQVGPWLQRIAAGGRAISRADSDSSCYWSVDNGPSGVPELPEIVLTLVGQRPGRLLLDVDAERLSEADARRLADVLVRAAEGLHICSGTDPDAPVAAIDLVGLSEHRRLIFDCAGFVDKMYTLFTK